MSSQVPRLAPKWPPIWPIVSMMYSRISCATCCSWASGELLQAGPPAIAAVIPITR